MASLSSSELRYLQIEGLQVCLSSIYPEHLEDLSQCFASLTGFSVRKIPYKFSTFSLTTMSFSPYQGHAIFQAMQKYTHVSAYYIYKAENSARQR